MNEIDFVIKPQSSKPIHLYISIYNNIIGTTCILFWINPKKHVMVSESVPGLAAAMRTAAIDLLPLEVL